MSTALALSWFCFLSRSMASRPKRAKQDLDEEGVNSSEGESTEEEDEENDLEKEEEDDDDDSEKGVDYDNSEKDIDEEVKVDFEAHAITDSDHNGIKKLLQQLFLKARVNTAEMTDIIIQQNHIGSVIKQAENMDDDDDDDDDDDHGHIFGFISLLNLTERKGTPCAEQIKELILSQCEKSCEQGMTEQLDKLLNDNSKPVGLLLSERFINVPAQIALPMHQQLQKELSEAQRTNKPCGKCYYFLLISKTYKEAAKNLQIKGGTPQKEELTFANAEDEFFYEKAVLKFDYSVQEESDTCLGGRWSSDDVPMKPLRTVMLIPTDKMDSIIDKFKEYLSV